MIRALEAELQARLRHDSPLTINEVQIALASSSTYAKALEQATDLDVAVSHSQQQASADRHTSGHAHWAQLISRRVGRTGMCQGC